MNDKKHYSFRSTFLLAIFFATLSIYGQKESVVTIEGYTPLPAGEEIRLIAFSDLLTNKPVTVASDKISKNGKFKLIYKSKEPELVQLCVRTSRAEFYIAPGRSYNFEIDMDPELFKLLDPGQFGGYVQIKSIPYDTNSLNHKINRFNTYFEDALAYYFTAIYHQKDKNSYDTLRHLLSTNFPIQYKPDDFYLSFIYYSLGIVDKIVYHKYVDTIYNRYFNNEYILYNNPAYMSLFKSLYKNYLYTSPRISKQILTQHINITPNYTELFNEVGKDPVLVNERIRELVIIYNLWELYHYEDLIAKNVLTLLEYIKDNTHFIEHKNIANNIIEDLLRYEGVDFIEKTVFRKENGGNFSLEKLKGKWVYIQFYNNLCLDCIREMMVIKELQDKYKDNIDFVSISVDFNFEDFTAFVNEYKMFDWQFLHFNWQYEWLNSMGIYSLPDNILIDPSGKIAERYAPDAGLKLAELLTKLFLEEEEEDRNPLFFNRSRH